MPRYFRPQLACFTLGLCLLMSSGCSGGKASAQGKVTYNGRPVKAGNLIFTGPDGLAVLAPITDGLYTVSGVGAGTVKVGVSNAKPATGVGGRGTGGREKAGPAAPQPAPAPKDPDWFPMPDQLSSPETSGFTVQMKSGSNDLDLDFK